MDRPRRMTNKQAAASIRSDCKNNPGLREEIKQKVASVLNNLDIQEVATPTGEKADNIDGGIGGGNDDNVDLEKEVYKFVSANTQNPWLRTPEANRDRQRCLECEFSFDGDFCPSHLKNQTTSFVFATEHDLRQHMAGPTHDPKFVLVQFANDMARTDDNSYCCPVEGCGHHDGTITAFLKHLEQQHGEVYRSVLSKHD